MILRLRTTVTLIAFMIIVEWLATTSSAGAANPSGGGVFPAGTQYCAESYTSDRPGVTWNHGSWFGPGPVNYAVDINFPGDDGTPLYAPSDGSVEQVTVPPGGGYGNSVVWTSADGTEQLHMAHITTVLATGEVVAGTQLGVLGLSGDIVLGPDGEVDPHLHITRAVDGEPAPLYLSGVLIEPDIDGHTFDPPHPYGSWPCAGTTYVSAGPLVTRYCDGRVATIVGTPGDDVLQGTEGADVIAGLQGDDVIHGLAGDDILCGGKGNDTIWGGQGFDIIFGAQGDDALGSSDGSRGAEINDTRGARMFGGSGNDQLHGSNRWDRMQGGPGLDSFFGYAGRDWIRGGPDGDWVNGGDGIDNIGVAGGNDTVIVGAGDSVRAGTGRDTCVLLGTPIVLWSCELVQ